MATHSPIVPNAPKPSLWDRYKDMWTSNFEQRQSFSSSLAAICREAIKDVRSAFMESYFGRPEHPGEPGTPLNPTAQIVTAEMGIDYADSLSHAMRPGRDRGEELTR